MTEQSWTYLKFDDAETPEMERDKCASAHTQPQRLTPNEDELVSRFCLDLFYILIIFGALAIVLTAN